MELLTQETRPFLKWIGGKRSILDELKIRMPERYKVYREPFLGGGALYFALQPKFAYLSDINFNLIVAYQTVRDNVEALLRVLEKYKKAHNKENYLRARHLFNQETDPIQIAALFIYLNKTCFNGLYRVNKSGQFNVPIGSYTNPSIYESELLRRDSSLLQGTIIEQHGFSQCVVEKEDFLYLDPPYHNTYAQYDGAGFGEADHKKLAGWCHKIHKRGAYFMLSNSDTPFVRSLYRSFCIDSVFAGRSVSCKSEQRKRENELIITNYK